MDHFWKILSMTFGFYTKKLVKDETITIIHIFTHISLNIDPRILNPHTPEYPFPLAGHFS